MDSVYDDKWLNINNVTTLSIDKLRKLETINANDRLKWFTINSVLVNVNELKINPRTCMKTQKQIEILNYQESPIRFFAV